MRGVKFGEKHSWRDFGLLTNEIKIGYPAVNTSFVSVPGRNGYLDITEGLGIVTYGMRPLSFHFTLRGIWEEKKQLITGYLHGKRLTITIDGDADYYYDGRLTVNDFLSSKKLSELVLQAECQPYKYHQRNTVHKEILRGEKEFILINDRMEVCPVIEVAGDNIILMTESVSYELAAGRHQILDIQLHEGYNRFKASGVGEIIFTYREGAL